MPRVKDLQEAQQLISVPADSRLLFRERLMKRFAAHEWVRVINPDDEVYIWQYFPSHAEEFEFTPDPMKITRRGETELYKLDPGESEVLLGENAYIMIEGLYKKLVSKRVIAKTPDQPAGMARSFNWTDGNLQEDWIKRIYLGKEKLNFDPTKEEEKPQYEVPEQPKAPAVAGRLRQNL
jgi:hypothetical protein